MTVGPWEDGDGGYEAAVVKCPPTPIATSAGISQSHHSGTDCLSNKVDLPLHQVVKMAQLQVALGVSNSEDDDQREHSLSKALICINHLIHTILCEVKVITSPIL